MKKILLITTGGTIASKESTSGGLTPGISHNELTNFVPEIDTICQFDSIGLMNLDSTNVGPVHWHKMARTIKDNYAKYDGFVITHGTDTLSYTAAALSYMIQNSPKPVILTGSQKSIYLRDTDARRNLLDAFIYAASNDASGVNIVFNSQVILGTRARKTRTFSYNAFDSIDYPSIATIQNGRVITYVDRREKLETADFNISMSSKVFVLKLVPGINPDVIENLGKLYKVIVVEAFGSGGLPNESGLSQSNSDCIKTAVDKFTNNGGIVVMTTQVPYEGSNLSTYEVGSILKDNPNILEGGNMTMEALTCKLMWILGQTEEVEEIKKLFYKQIAFDIL